ncbi:hypothetical protein SRHO_G00077840 [Serrasalmus rhombeus]
MSFLHTWLLFTLVRAADPPCSLRGPPNPPQLSRDGDVMIGGIFSFHNSWDQATHTFTSGPQQPKCKRTIPSDYYQSRALAKLVSHFGWTWVGALCSDNDYGNNGMNTFITAAKEEGVCIEFSEAFFRTDPRENILRILEIIKGSSSKVIVAFVSYSDMEVLLKEMALQNITGLQWIGSESWISDMNIATTEWQHILRGSMGFAIPKAKIYGLGEFLTKLNSSSEVELYKELWETIFECKLATEENAGMKEICKGNETLSEVQNQYTDVSELQIANSVYKAVYAVAYALDKTYNCSKRESGQESVTVCINTTHNRQPWQVLSELKKLHFSTTTNEEVYFDENGDPAAKYDLLNWQQSKDGKITFVKVGFYDASLQAHLQISFNNISIIWANNNRQAEESVCRRLGTALLPELTKEGDFNIGGIFNFRTGQDGQTFTFQSLPAQAKCKATIPSDYYQSRALAQLVKYFGWTWVGAISNKYDYGVNGIATFIIAAQEEGVCIEYWETFTSTDSASSLAKVVHVIKQSTAKVVMAFMSHVEIKVLLDLLYQQNITGLQWIGSDAWITDNTLTESLGYTALIGSLGFTVPRAQIPGLDLFLQEVNPSRFPNSIFLKEFWESVFNCSLTPRAGLRTCNGSEQFKNVKTFFTDVSDLRFTNNVYKAVYAVAHALHKLLSCEENKGPFPNATCAKPSNIQQWQVCGSLHNTSHSEA